MTKGIHSSRIEILGF